MFGCATSPIAALLERLTMNRTRMSPGAGKTPTDLELPTTPAPNKSKSSASAPSSPKSPRNPANTFWIHEQQKRVILHHLAEWALNHESCLHFHGKISLESQSVRRSGHLELGKPIKCILTDSTFTDARQIIVVKLFPPQEYATPEERDDDASRRDSMELIGTGPNYQQPNLRVREGRAESRPNSASKARRHYKLVIRCGAGWMSARDYFSKLYISRLDVQLNNPVGRLEHDEHLTHRSRALGPAATDDDSVTIRPLFHAFQKLPAELKELILMTAAGLSGSYDLRSDDYGTLQPGGKDRAAISLSTLFRVSKNITDHLQTHIYHSTDFHFGLTGFTNFLWQSGPEKRHEIRRLTFHFGKLALLHCIRWLAPDAIFLLFEPPVATNPRSLQYFWRCQIQDLVKDLHLFTLTVDIKQIDRTDLPMMIAIMKSAFGSIEKLRFVETDNKGITTPVTLDDKRLSELRKKHTWRQMCLEYYEAHRVHSYFYKFELLKGQVKDLEAIMAKENTFFNTPFSPLVPREEFPASA
ncbi:hypothetical protein HBI72_017450 [Parastagonospora nodorum]|nr:hypothetical protein HBI72_017450 [Parastagonospora nodorum]